MCSTVAVLFAHRGPAYVAGLVMAVVVDAVNCVPLGWLRSDVFVERQKVVEPFVADTYPSPAVIGVVIVARLQAAILHRLPCFVLWRHFSDFSVAVCQLIAVCVTAAPFRLAAQQVVGCDDALDGAHATTGVLGFSVLGLRRCANHGPSSEHSANRNVPRWSRHKGTLNYIGGALFPPG